MKVALCIVAALLVGQACAESYAATSKYADAQEYDPALAPEGYGSKDDGKVYKTSSDKPTKKDYKEDMKATKEEAKYDTKDKDLFWKLAPGAKDYAGSAPMQCTGHAYCFAKVVEKVEVEPKCESAGFAYDEKLKKCYKVLDYTCGEGEVPCKEAMGKCYACKKGEFVNKDNKCEKLCKDGYDAVTVNGDSYCVKKCKEGYTPMGQDCVKFSDSHTPKECSAKKCGMGKKLYFVSKSSGSPYADAYASSVGSVYKAADKAYADSYAKDSKKDDAECVCAKTMERDIYEKDPCTDPKIVDGKKNVDFCDAHCADGSEPKRGKCEAVCPAGCSEDKKGKCSMGCPKGFKACKSKKGETLCATTYDLFGCDSCKVLEKMYSKLDKEYECRYVAPKPSPKPLPSPAKPLPSPAKPMPSPAKPVTLPGKPAAPAKPVPAKAG